MSSRIPSLEQLKVAAPDHVEPAPKLQEKSAGKGGVVHVAYRLECVCGHVTVWSAAPEQAVSKWMNHLALAAGLKQAVDHRKVTPGSHPR